MQEYSPSLCSSTQLKLNPPEGQICTTVIIQTPAITQQCAVIMCFHPCSSHTLFKAFPDVKPYPKACTGLAKFYQSFSENLLLIYRQVRDIVLAWVLCQVSSVSQQERRPCAYECLTPEDNQALGSNSPQSYSCALHRKLFIIKKILKQVSVFLQKVKHGHTWPKYI